MCVCVCVYFLNTRTHYKYDHIYVYYSNTRTHYM